MEYTEEQLKSKGVYCLTFPNGKRYVGYTCKAGGFQARWFNHKAQCKYPNSKDYNSKKGEAIREFGWENVKKEILVFSDDRRFCKKLEIALIDAWRLNYKRHGGDCPGVNGTDGGDGSRGAKHSQATKDKMKNKIISEETKQRMSESAKERVTRDGVWIAGKHHSEETILKLKNTPKTKEWRDNLSKANIGRKPWNKGTPRTQEEKLKMRNTNKLLRGKIITIRNIATNEEHTGCLRELDRLFGINRKTIQRGQITKGYIKVDTTTPNNNKEENK